MAPGSKTSEAESVLRPLTLDDSRGLSWESYFAPEHLKEELMNLADSWAKAKSFSRCLNSWRRDLTSGQ